MLIEVAENLISASTVDNTINSHPVTFVGDMNISNKGDFSFTHTFDFFLNQKEREREREREMNSTRLNVQNWSRFDCFNSFLCLFYSNCNIYIYIYIYIHTHIHTTNFIMDCCYKSNPTVLQVVSCASKI